jgi:alpha-L-arabinofuranosidase
VLAVHAGYPLHGEHVAPGPALQPFVDDVPDEMEDVTGDALTKLGGRRERQRDLERQCPQFW